jgi:hypothetical protein
MGVIISYSKSFQKVKEKIMKPYIRRNVSIKPTILQTIPQIVAFVDGQFIHAKEKSILIRRR